MFYCSNKVPPISDFVTATTSILWMQKPPDQCDQAASGKRYILSNFAGKNTRALSSTTCPCIIALFFQHVWCLSVFPCAINTEAIPPISLKSKSLATVWAHIILNTGVILIFDWVIFHNANIIVYIICTSWK